MGKEIRQAYGEALVKYGENNQNVVVLDADVSSSTKSCLFGNRFPERFFNVGIAEANMMSMAAGLATVGKIPFVNTFAVFITSIGLISARAFGSYSHIPVKMAGAYGGLSDAFDGPSHHSVEDIAIMRSLPNYKVYVASDVVLTDWLVKNAIEDPNPMYIRLSRDSMPDLYSEGTQFTDGKGIVVREGKDATIIACGLMVSTAVAAAEQLEKEGISVRVVDMFCIKPLDTQLILRCAKETGAIISAEEHSVIGGLGGAAAETLCVNAAVVPMGFVGIQDTHGECGPYKTLLKAYGLDADSIIKTVKETVSRK
jgi:transketolase